MKVIILNGSPKAQGNTARALREVEQTLNQQTETLNKRMAALKSIATQAEATLKAMTKEK